jgi:hypothetical protein
VTKGWVLFVVIGGIFLWALWYWRKPKKVSYKKPIPVPVAPVMGHPIEDGVEFSTGCRNSFGNSKLLEQIEKLPPERLALEPLEK